MIQILICFKIDKCNGDLSWLDYNQLAEKEEFEDKLKRVTSFCNSISPHLCYEVLRKFFVE